MLDGHSVLVAHPDAFKPVELARALAAVRKVPVQDATLEANVCWGILGEGLTADAAVAIAEKFAHEGIPALPFPAGRIKEPPAPRLARSLALSEEGLSFPDEAGGDPVRLFWKDAALVAAAVFPETTSRVKNVIEGFKPGDRLVQLSWIVVTGLPGKSPSKNEVRREVSETELAFCLDIVFRRPASRVRVVGDRFDYQCLGQDKSYDSFTNFRRLVVEAARRAGPALQNRGVKGLLAGEPVRKLGYRRLEDLDRECRWILTLKGNGLL